MLEVHENEIALRKFSDGTAQLCICVRSVINCKMRDQSNCYEVIQHQTRS